MSSPRTQPAFLGTQVQRGREGVELAEHRLGLTVEDGPDGGAACEVRRHNIVIGSADGCDLVLKDPTVSRRHCEIRASRRGYVLRDLGSRNGTLVGATLIREAVLLPGARFRVGENVLTFQPRRRWSNIQPEPIDRFGGLRGRTQSMRVLYALLDRVAPSELSCLFVGETGTGKELAARALHEHSRRSEGPFIVVDCGAVPRTLFESELFGHEAGAFTGAREQRTGLIEAAHGGTLFLDEIGELPPSLQPKLLRALDRRQVRRLGGNDPLDVDVRVVAATHRDLLASDFREDLFYRLSEIVLELPPLRARVGDIPLIAEGLLEDFNPVPTIGAQALQWLMQQPWPGNIRELRNVLRRAALLSEAGIIDLNAVRAAHEIGESAVHEDPEGITSLPLAEARQQWLAPMERRYLERLLERYGDDLTLAASEAGIHRKSLLRLLRRHGLRGA